MGPWRSGSRRSLGARRAGLNIPYTLSAGSRRGCYTPERSGRCRGRLSTTARSSTIASRIQDFASGLPGDPLRCIWVASALVPAPSRVLGGISRRSIRRLLLTEAAVVASLFQISNVQWRESTAMANANRDRVPIEPQSVDAPLSRAAVFLVVTIAPGMRR